MEKSQKQKLGGETLFQLCLVDHKMTESVWVVSRIPRMRMLCSRCSGVILASTCSSQARISPGQLGWERSG